MTFVHGRSLQLVPRASSSGSDTSMPARHVTGHLEFHTGRGSGPGRANPSTTERDRRALTATYKDSVWSVAYLSSRLERVETRRNRSLLSWLRSSTRRRSRTSSNMPTSEKLNAAKPRSRRWPRRSGCVSSLRYQPGISSPHESHGMSASTMRNSSLEQFRDLNCCGPL